jgi:hypothetical protein
VDCCHPTTRLWSCQGSPGMFTEPTVRDGECVAGPCFSQLVLKAVPTSQDFASLETKKSVLTCCSSSTGISQTLRAPTCAGRVAKSNENGLPEMQSR